jgi:hypothetical protein
MSSGSNASDYHVLFAGGSAGGKVTAFHAGQAIAARVADTLLLVDDVWYHYAVTYDGTSGDMILYRDGAQVASGTAPPFSDQTLYIGGFTPVSNMWEGNLDDVRLYGHVLSPEQILALYHGSDTIRSTETNVGEQWHTDVTAFSTIEMGTTVTSNTLQIHSETAGIWMEPDTVYYQHSEAFYLNTYCDSDLVGAKVFHFELTFDPSVVVLPADSVSLGSMFAGLEDDSTVLFTQLWINPTHLEIDIAYLSDSATLSGPGEIMVLPAVPTGFGQTDIQITEVLIFDRYNQQIPASPVGSTYARICQFVGDVNQSNNIDISDLVYVVDYMFNGGPVPLPSVWSANFNCDESAIDISDLVAFVDWMFTQGPFICDPPCVPEL